MCKSRNRVNRIDYIVRGNPQGAGKLLYDAGFEVPETEDDLVDAMKEWISVEGEPAIRQLLTIHPERKAIMESNTPDKHDSFCGCEHAYSGDGGCGCHHSFTGTPGASELVAELRRLTTSELKARKAELDELVSLSPRDAELVEEQEITQAVLNTRFEPEPGNDEDQESDGDYMLQLTKRDVGLGAFVLGLAFIVSRIK